MFGKIALPVTPGSESRFQGPLKCWMEYGRSRYLTAPGGRAQAEWWPVGPAMQGSLLSFPPPEILSGPRRAKFPGSRHGAEQNERDAR